jgi:hypothetical protein
MSDLQSLSLDELEARCDKGMLDFLRSLHHDDPQAYRDALIDDVNRPRLPIDDILTAIRSHSTPSDAWRAVLATCRESAFRAPWDYLPAPDIERDIEAARHWLALQLPGLRDVTGIYLGLDTLNMGGRRGTNVEIGGSASCDPTSDSQDWICGELKRGSKHLIRGLRELKVEYSKARWKVRDESVAQGSYSSFADYTLFLGYSGILLGHAFSRLTPTRPLLAAWGFHDGDLFLLGRMTSSGFDLLCQ